MGHCGFGIFVVTSDDQRAAILRASWLSVSSKGPLREGWRIQRDTPGYGPRRTAEELRRDLAAAKRYSHR